MNLYLDMKIGTSRYPRWMLVLLLGRKQRSKIKTKKNTRIQKKAKETKKEKTISAENRLKNKFMAARVRIFVVSLISGNKTFF